MILKQGTGVYMTISLDFLNSIIDLSPDIHYVYDLLSKENIYSNAGVKNILGYTSLEVKDMETSLIERVMHEEDFKDYQNKVCIKYKSIKDGESITNRYRFKHKDETWRWLELREYIFKRTSDQKPWQIYGVARDITQTIEVENRYQNLFEEMLDGFSLQELICDEKGEPVDILYKATNPAYYKHTGLKANVVGKKVRDIIPDSNQYWIDTFSKVTLTGEPVVFENYSRELNRHFIVKAYKLSSKHFACIFSDITKLKEVEKRLNETKVAAEAANVAKTHFLANMSHELRTPLNAILGFSNYILCYTYKNLTEEQRNQIDRIVKAGDHLLAIINDLLSLSSIEAGGMAITKKPIDGNEILRDLIEVNRFFSREKNIELSYDIKLTRKIEIDLDRFTEVMNNLLANAIKYSRPGGKAGVIATENNKEAIITVWDNGIGIEKSYQEKIFGEFEQLSDPYRGKNSGLGLGLSIARKLINLHGGKLSLKSNIGEGSQFTFNLPYGQSTDEDMSLSLVDPLSNCEDKFFKNLTYLVVEDDKDCIDVIKIVLSQKGINVLYAQTGENALAIAVEEKIDVILVDIGLPDISGVDLLGKFKSLDKTKDIPVIAVTAYVLRDEKSLFHDCDFSGIIYKPLDISELPKQISSILSKANFQP